MKLIFICSSACIIWYMRKHKVVSQTYDAEQDTFRVIFLIGPSMLLAIMINHEFSVTEVLYTEFGDPKYRPCPLIRKMVDAGHLGQKTGRGFYDYSQKSKL